MYDHSLHRERKHFCRYCLHALITEEIFRRHMIVFFKINGKQTIKMPVLVPEDNKKRNPKSYTKKYQKHIACSYGYKLVRVDDKFSKSFKSYLLPV